MLFCDNSLIPMNLYSVKAFSHFSVLTSLYYSREINNLLSTDEYQVLPVATSVISSKLTSPLSSYRGV
jgi:hypothetical protein